MEMTKQAIRKLIQEVNYLENCGSKYEAFLDEMAAERLEVIWQMITDYRVRLLSR